MHVLRLLLLFVVRTEKVAVLSERFINGFFLTGAVLFATGGAAMIRSSPLQGIGGLALAAYMGTFYYRLKNHENFDLSSPIDGRFIDRCLRAVECRFHRKPKQQCTHSSSSAMPEEVSQTLQQFYGSSKHGDIRASKWNKVICIGSTSNQHAQKVAVATSDIYSAVRIRVNALSQGAEMLRPAGNQADPMQLLRGCTETSNDTTLLRAAPTDYPAHQPREEVAHTVEVNR